MVVGNDECIAKDRQRHGHELNPPARQVCDVQPPLKTRTKATHPFTMGRCKGTPPRVLFAKYSKQRLKYMYRWYPTPAAVRHPCKEALKAKTRRDAGLCVLTNYLNCTPWSITSMPSIFARYVIDKVLVRWISRA